MLGKCPVRVRAGYYPFSVRVCNVHADFMFVQIRTLLDNAVLSAYRSFSRAGQEKAKMI